jgi:mannose-6-phosphate isomerase-like protein (cupin superfamily)
MIKAGDTIINIRTGQRMTFLQTWLETNGMFLQIECESPVSNTREHLHLHPYQENRFQIVSGELTFSIDGTIHKASEGTTLSVPKNVLHEFWNEGNVSAVYIQEFFPALKIDQLFETFFALARDGKLNKKGKPNIFRASVIMLHFQNELRLAQYNWTLQKIVFTLLAPIGKLLGYSETYE